MNYLSFFRFFYLKTKIVVLVALNSAGILSILFAQQNDIKFDHISIEQGLSQSSVTCTVQDHKGFMWFGTQDGLNRYDGYRFTVYKHDPDNPNSISNNYIRAIYADSNEIGNVLWVGTWGGGLNKLDQETGTFYHYKHDPENPKSLSNDYIKSIYIDSRGDLWIGTDGGGLDMFIRETGTFYHYKHDPHNPNSLNNDYVNSIHSNPNELGNVLWIGTRKGLNRFDYDTKSFTHYIHDSENPNSISSNNVSSIYSEPEEPGSALWVGTWGGGLNRLDRETGIFYHYENDPENPNSLTNDYIQSIHVDPSGVVWVGTDGGGLCRLNWDDRKTGVFARYQNEPANQKSLSHDYVLSIYEDKSGAIWFGTWGSGLSKFDPYKYKFLHYKHDPENPNSLNSNTITAIYEDQSKVLWIGTLGAGLNRWDRDTSTFAHYTHEPENPNSLIDNAVWTIYQDHIGRLWVGTSGGLSRLIRDEHGVETFVHWTVDPDNRNSLSNKGVRAIIEDRSGMLWIGTLNGLNKIDPETKRATRYLHDPQNPNSLSHNSVSTIHEDQWGTLWIGTQSGLNRLDLRTKTTIRFLHDPENPNSLSFDEVSTIHEDKNGILWIGTYGGGLNKFDPKNSSWTHYREKNGLSNDVIYGILEDDYGHLWISTNNGLSRFNPRTETFRNYSIQDGLQSNEFNMGAYHKSRIGEMFFGGINGFNTFYPEDIRDNPYNPTIVISDFQIFNKSVSISTEADGRSILQKQITETKAIELSYKDYVFSFEFAALSYTAPEKNRYAYIMEGFDKDWTFTDAQRRFATYTNLPAGDYIFKVKGTNHDGVWNESGTSISITIIPPPWKTWWAYASYMLFIIGSVYATIQGRTAQIKRRSHQLEQLVEERTAEVERQKVRIEVQVEKLKELDKMKSQFFANISHEFRTPLTLIRGPLEDLRSGKRGAVAKNTLSQLDMSLRNVGRLQKLIEQLLDLSKLEAGKLTLKTARYDLVYFMKRVLDAFSSLAKKKRITLAFQTDASAIELYYDEDLLEKVMNNLLSNALKFTPKKRTILINLQDTSPGGEDMSTGIFVTVKVTDTGRGIPPKDLSHIFDRFYQADSSITRKHEGTGIGLAFSKEVIELHGGEIFVESEVGFGTTFTLKLPKGTAHLSEDEIVTMKETDAVTLKPETVSIEPSDELEQIDFGKEISTPPKEAPTILIVEDNDDMRQYVSEQLSPYYHVAEAPDGKVGLEKTKDLIPDLIISDIMMPEMDGIAMTQAIREDETVSTIPIILLTARADEEDRIAGLETQADDYITKPFSPEELKARIKNLIERRRQLIEKFRRQVLSVEPDKLELEPANKAFLSQLIQAIEAHMSEPDFTVETLAKAVYVSKRQLHRRLKYICGLAPAVFIRELRLKRAKQLLEQRALSTVAEVAYAVGFSNTSYFSRLYRRTFGQSPVDLIRE